MSKPAFLFEKENMDTPEDRATTPGQGYLDYQYPGTVIDYQEGWDDGSGNYTVNVNVVNSPAPNIPEERLREIESVVNWPVTPQPVQQDQDQQIQMDVDEPDLFADMEELEIPANPGDANLVFVMPPGPIPDVLPFVPVPDVPPPVTPLSPASPSQGNIPFIPPVLVPAGVAPVQDQPIANPRNTAYLDRMRNFFERFDFVRSTCFFEYVRENGEIVRYWIPGNRWGRFFENDTPVVFQVDTRLLDTITTADINTIRDEIPWFYSLRDMNLGKSFVSTHKKQILDNEKLYNEITGRVEGRAFGYRRHPDRREMVKPKKHSKCYDAVRSFDNATVQLVFDEVDFEPWLSMSFVQEKLKGMEGTRVEMPIRVKAWFREPDEDRAILYVKQPRVDFGEQSVLNLPQNAQDNSTYYIVQELDNSFYCGNSVDYDPKEKGFIRKTPSSVDKEIEEILATHLNTTIWVLRDLIQGFLQLHDNGITHGRFSHGAIKYYLTVERESFTEDCRLRAKIGDLALLKPLDDQRVTAYYPIYDGVAMDNLRNDRQFLHDILFYLTFSGLKANYKRHKNLIKDLEKTDVELTRVQEILKDELKPKFTPGKFFRRIGSFLSAENADWHQPDSPVLDNMGIHWASKEAFVDDEQSRFYNMCVKNIMQLRAHSDERYIDTNDIILRIMREIEEFSFPVMQHGVEPFRLQGMVNELGVYTHLNRESLRFYGLKATEKCKAYLSLVETSLLEKSKPFAFPSVYAIPGSFLYFKTLSPNHYISIKDFVKKNYEPNKGASRLTPESTIAPMFSGFYEAIGFLHAHNIFPFKFDAEQLVIEVSTQKAKMLYLKDWLCYEDPRDIVVQIPEIEGQFEDVKLIQGKKLRDESVEYIEYTDEDFRSMRRRRQQYPIAVNVSDLPENRSLWSFETRFYFQKVESQGIVEHPELRLNHDEASLESNYCLTSCIALFAKDAIPNLAPGFLKFEDHNKNLPVNSRVYYAELDEFMTSGQLGILFGYHPRAKHAQKTPKSYKSLYRIFNMVLVPLNKMEKRDRCTRFPKDTTPRPKASCYKYHMYEAGGRKDAREVCQYLRGPV